MKLENVSHNARPLTDQELADQLEGPNIARLAIVRAEHGALRPEAG